MQSKIYCYKSKSDQDNKAVVVTQDKGKTLIYWSCKPIQIYQLQSLTEAGDSQKCKFQGASRRKKRLFNGFYDGIGLDPIFMRASIYGRMKEGRINSKKYGLSVQSLASMAYFWIKFQNSAKQFKHTNMIRYDNKNFIKFFSLTDSRLTSNAFKLKVQKFDWIVRNMLGHRQTRASI